MDTFEQQFEDTAEIAAGVVIYFESPAGDEVPATIVSVEGSEVMVDFNHPLAGRDLKFEVKVISIED
jgi:FKBP-type peptidyl-prolyl cis-trans isomerase 2